MKGPFVPISESTREHASLRLLGVNANLLFGATSRVPRAGNLGVEIGHLIAAEELESAQSR